MSGCNIKDHTALYCYQVKGNSQEILSQAVYMIPCKTEVLPGPFHSAECTDPSRPEGSRKKQSQAFIVISVVTQFSDTPGGSILEGNIKTLTVII